MARSHTLAPRASLLHRPPRPLPTRMRVEAFLAEVLDEALEDGLVEVCPRDDGDGPGYRITEAGQEWLLDFPPMMLGCAPRVHSIPPTPPSTPREPPTSKSV